MEEYETSVDIDGDGHWDDVSATGHADGSVTLEGDVDGDGRIDFVGYDADADGLVDHAEYDTDGDGVLDTRWTDHDGDGWLDDSEPIVDDRAGSDGAEDPAAGGSGGGTGDPADDGIRSKVVPAPGT
jgi:heat shock protein beta